MVWLAVGGSTAIFGYLLYRHFSVSASLQNDDSEIIEDDAHGEMPNEANPSFAFEQPADEQPLPISSTQGEAESRTNSDGNIIKISKAEEKRESALKLTRTISPPPSRSSSPPRLKPPTFSKMRAPPRPGGSALRPPPSAAASLRVQATRALPNTSMAPTSSTLPQNKKPSRKVNLQPGHSPLDWAMLTKNPNSQLRGKDLPSNLIRITPSQLKQYSGRKGRDAWSVYQGKVYNITPYLPFHPGGEGELMRGAGKDAGKLFMEVHPWVNWENMLAECMVGILVGEDEHEDDKSGGLEEMD